MRRLLLLRHAKSASPDGVRDHERPLAPRGRKAAPLMAAYLRDEQLFPDLALVSSSRRTRETWDLVRPALGEVETRFEPRIYEAPSERLLAVLREVPPSVRTLMIVGHNPGSADLARLLIGHGDRYAYARMAHKFPTAGLAVIDFATDGWAEVKPGGGRLDRFVTPKSVGADEDD
jgi:phosphohistidine phosphatase